MAQNTTKQEVAAGMPGFVEAVQLAVAPDVELGALLDVNWSVHDPTGHKAAIFYHSASQQDEAHASRNRARQMRPHLQFSTCIRPATAFWEVP